MVGGEGGRKRKREGSGEVGEVGGGEQEQVGDSQPRKRVERSSVQREAQSAEHEQQEETTSEGPHATKDRSLEPSKLEDEIKVTLASNGQPQVSLGIPGYEVQDAFFISGVSLPLRTPSPHASVDELNTPLPKSVRDELLATESASRASNNNTKKPFSLLMAFCRNSDTLLTLVSYLPIPSLISLYATSKTFHYLFNRHHTAFIMASVRTWAPNADMIFPWRCYKSLCTNDPLLRQKMKYRGLDAEEAEFRFGVRGRDLRDVPTLRWLQMVVWREGVCKDMLIMLATKGLRCPPGTFDAVKVGTQSPPQQTEQCADDCISQRMWFLMDLPLNSQRIALIRTSSYIGNHTLYGMTAFLLKVDMAFTLPDQAAYPARHSGMPANWAHNIPTGVPLRKLLLAERHLTPLWRVLRGWTWDPTYPAIPMTSLDALRLWARHKFRMPDDAPDGVKAMSVMGIPWHSLGTAGLERTGVAFYNLDGKTIPVTHPAILSRAAAATHLGKQILYPHRRVFYLPRVLEKPRELLLRPDELVVKEGVRRQMDMHTEWVHMMLWGFCDEVGFNWPVFSEGELLRMDRREKSVVEFMLEKQSVLSEVAAAEVWREE